MSEVLRKINENQYIFWCEGCQSHHYLQVSGVPKWDWDGDLVRPTANPSFLCRSTEPVTDAEVEAILSGVNVEPKTRVCHFFIKKGNMEYLNDCTHKLMGQTVPMTPIDAV